MNPYLIAAIAAFIFCGYWFIVWGIHVYRTDDDIGAIGATFAAFGLVVIGVVMILVGAVGGFVLARLSQG